MSALRNQQPARRPLVRVVCPAARHSTARGGRAEPAGRPDADRGASGPSPDAECAPRPDAECATDPDAECATDPDAECATEPGAQWAFTGSIDTDSRTPAGTVSTDAEAGHSATGEHDAACTGTAAEHTAGCAVEATDGSCRAAAGRPVDADEPDTVGSHRSAPEPAGPTGGAATAARSAG